MTPITTRATLPLTSHGDLLSPGFVAPVGTWQPPVLDKKWEDYVCIIISADKTFAAATRCNCDRVYVRMNEPRVLTNATRIIFACEQFCDTKSLDLWINEHFRVADRQI